MANIVFDLDGTLVDSGPSLAAAGNRLLVGLDRPPVTVSAYLAFIGHGMRRQVEDLLRATGGIPGGDVVPHLAAFRALYDADPVTGVLVYPGVVDALRELKARGHVLGICTQKPLHPARMILGGLGLSPFFDAITGGDSLPVLKPDPAMLAHTLAQMPDGAALYVGDSEVDAQTAAGAGIPFILHDGGYRAGEVPANARFVDYAALPGIVAQLT